MPLALQISAIALFLVAPPASPAAPTSTQPAAPTSDLPSHSPSASELGPSQHPAAAPISEILKLVSLEDLIRQLPPAGLERNPRSDGEVDPAAVEMQRRMDLQEKLTDDQWRIALLNTGAIRTRAKWPRDKPYAISLTIPRWLGFVQIRLDPEPAGLKSIEVGELMASMSGTMPSMRRRDARVGQTIGVLPAGTTEITMHIEVERGKSFLADLDDKEVPKTGILWRGSITVPVTLVDSFDQISDAVDDELLSEAVRDAVGAGFRQWGGGPGQVPFLLIDPDCEKYPILATTGLDIKAELLDDGKVIADGWLVASNFDTLTVISSIRSSRIRFYGSANLKVTEDDKKNQANWVVRLSGRTDHNWMHWHATQHWSGTLTIPWPELVEHEAKRTAIAQRGPEMSSPYMK